MRTPTLVIALVVAGCAPQHLVRESKVTVNDEDSIEATLPSGAVVSGWEEYDLAAPTEIPPIEELGTYALTVADGSQTDAASKGLNLGKFRISLAPDANYLEGCIRRKFLHLKIVVENTRLPQPMAEIHMLGWFENSGPCFGFMNTGFIGYGWCQKFCVADAKEGVKKGLAGAMTAAGASVVTAAVLSKLLAPLAAATMGY